MASAVVTSLRARADTVTVGTPGADALTIRVQLAEAWDAVRVTSGSGESVTTVKEAALAALDPSAGPSGDYVVTFRGAEMLDEAASLRDAGVAAGSTLLLALRRRRPVR